MSHVAPKIFITYRREETSGHSGRLYDSLVSRFGEPSVFMDLELEPGIDFVERITQAVGACQVLLAVIGPRWTTLTDAEGRPRINDAEDFVRLEVEAALRRPDVTVIPVLVGGARMPSAAELPEALRPLTRRNAIELSDQRWHYDVGRLVQTLAELLAETMGWEIPPPPEPPAPASPLEGRSPARLLLEAVLVAAAAGMAARLLGELIPEDPEGEVAEYLTRIVRRAETWALVGAAMASWITVLRDETGAVPRRALIGLVAGAAAGATTGAIANISVLPEVEMSTDLDEGLEVASIAVIGAVIGALVGWLWLPRRVGAALVAGMAAGGLTRLVMAGWDTQSSAEQVLSVGIQCFAIAGFAVATMLALDAPRRAAMPRPRPGG